MYRYLLFVLAAFFLAACGSSKINVVYPDYTKYKSNDFDLRVMKAYNYEYYKQYKEARDEFLSLYQDYNNTNFLENAFLLSLANNLDRQAELNNLAKPYLNQNDNLKRLSVLYALSSNDINNAQKLMKELLTKKDSDPRNLELYGDILVKKNDLKNATKYYRSAYNQVQNEEILFKLIGIYAILNDTLNMAGPHSQKVKGEPRATCVDCHLPHNFVAKWIAKAQSGLGHAYAFTFKLDELPTNLSATEKSRKMVQENCIRCHADFAQTAINATTNPHADKSLNCASCHKDVGHKHGI